MAKEPPTIIVNKFAIITGGPYMRFAFGEQVLVGGEVGFHTAIMMSLIDAKELADCIYKTISDVKEQGTLIPKDSTIN